MANPRLSYLKAATSSRYLCREAAQEPLWYKALSIVSRGWEVAAQDAHSRDCDIWKRKSDRSRYCHCGGYCQLGAKEAKLPRAQPSRQYTSAHEGNTSRIAPGEEGAITSSSVLTGRETMTAELEMIVDRSVGGEELLRMPG